MYIFTKRFLKICNIDVYYEYILFNTAFLKICNVDV